MTFQAGIVCLALAWCSGYLARWAYEPKSPKRDKKTGRFVKRVAE